MERGKDTAPADRRAVLAHVGRRCVACRDERMHSIASSCWRGCVMLAGVPRDLYRVVVLQDRSLDYAAVLAAIRLEFVEYPRYTGCSEPATMFRQSVQPIYVPSFVQAPRAAQRQTRPPDPAPTPAPPPATCWRPSTCRWAVLSGTTRTATLSGGCDWRVQRVMHACQDGNGDSAGVGGSRRVQRGLPDAARHQAARARHWCWRDHGAVPTCTHVVA